MLAIVQTGQAGKTALLFDMHRLRKRVFRDRLGWEVNFDQDGLEVDQFDLPQTVYLLALDPEHRVIGDWRLLSAAGPTMIRDIWPQFLDDIDMPRNADVWETSRFAVDSLEGSSAEGLAQVNRATQELFCGLTELCLLCGIREIFTMYDMRIARLLRRLDCEPRAVSRRQKIADTFAQVGAFTTDEAMLARLRAATNIADRLITPDMLPPLLQERREQMLARRTDHGGSHRSGGALYAN